jgi:pSer/pThr/pTyr-binding forkhead associated (FHA) protein
VDNRGVADLSFGPHTSTPSELEERLNADRSGFPYLLYRDGGGHQQIVALAERGDRLTLGRDQQSDIPLPWDAEVSRAHVQLERVGVEWAIIDDGLSRNGTFVNGDRLRGRRRLAHGDVVRCGDTVLVFRAPLAASDVTVAAGNAPPARISEAQRRVLIALCRPFRDGGAFATPASNQEIADELVISTEAVKTHVRALFQRLSVEDLPQHHKRVRLVELAFQQGLVAPRDLSEPPRR